MFGRILRLFVIVNLLMIAPCLAGPIPLVVNVSENVNVTGTPRLQLNIGGVTRYADYTGGTGTSALTFSYTVQSGDFDFNGIGITSPIDLNGGTIKDVNGNDATLTFVPPNTSGVLVQSYQVAFTTSPIDSTNETAAAFNITGAPMGATYNYTITSSGGAGSVTGSGTISADPQSVSGVNVSGLPFGTLTVSVTITNATGTGNAKTGTVAGSWTAPLDALPSSASAFSVRRLLTSYTGPLVQVRRSSDNVTQDIGVTFAGNLNTTALTTFCGANSCFVSKWYDQSGNARDVVQATLGNQPRIVNAGTIDTFNSRPAIFYDGAGDFLKQSAGVLGGMSSSSVLAVSKMNVANARQMFDIRDVGNQTSLIDDGNGDGFAGRRRNTSNTLVSTAIMTKDTTAHIMTVTYDSSTSTLSHSKDGGAANTATSTGGTTTSFCITLANNGFSNTSPSFNGHIPEFLFFQSLLSGGNLSTIRGNQKAYFGTP